MKIDIPYFGNSFSVEASQVIYAGGAIDSGIRLASLKKEMSDLDVEKERQELQLTRLRNTGKVMNRKIVTILHLPEETVIIPDSTVLASEIPVLCEQYWHDKANSGNISLRQSDISVRIKEVPALNNNFNWWYVGIGVRMHPRYGTCPRGKLHRKRIVFKRPGLFHYRQCRTLRSGIGQRGGIRRSRRLCLRCRSVRCRHGEASETT